MILTDGWQDRWRVSKPTSMWVAMCPLNSGDLDSRLKQSKAFDTHAEALAYAVEKSGQ